MYPYVSFLNITLPSYGICLVIAIFLCSFLSIRRSSHLGIMLEDMIILAASSVGVGLLGGGFLYLLVTYSPTQLLELFKAGDFSFITNGGLVFFGSLIAGILNCIFVAKLLHLDIVMLEKSIVPWIPLGHSIGRIGCLLAGCCHGFEYTGLFAVTSKLFSDSSFFPLQPLEAGFNLLITVFLLNYAKKPRYPYSILSCYLLLYSILRFFLEFFRGDSIRGHFLSLSTSQWISLLLIIICIIQKIIAKKAKKNGR